jgi:CBS domain-containing protein
MDDVALNALRGTSLTIRELLARWGYRIRNADSVPRVRFDLEQVGLMTDPPFEAGAMDTKVRVVPIAAPETGPVTASAPSGTVPTGTAGDAEPIAEPVVAPPDDVAEDLPAAAMRVDDLPSARTPVVCVKPDDTLTYATTLMLKLDYSQIPVVEGDSHLHGVVTWQSVARMYASLSDKNLTNAIDHEVQTVNTWDSLLATLPIIVGCDFVLVRNQPGQICGIVTTADLAVQFGGVARPYFMIGEIERRLRGFLAPVFDGDPAVRRATKKRTDQVGSMMFGEYIALLKMPQNWVKLGWSFVDHDLFIELLDGVRKIRNAVAHFRPMTLTASENQRVDELLLMLKNISP